MFSAGYHLTQKFLAVHALQMVTEHSEMNSEAPMQLPSDDEEDLCKVWDMAMDKVQFFYPDIPIKLIVFLKVTTTQ